MGSAGFYILEAIGDAIGNMMLAIVNANDKLWQAGWNWIKETATGIKNAIKLILAVWDTIKTKIKEKINNIINEAKNWRQRFNRGFQARNS